MKTMTETERLAVAYGRGEATVEEVVASATAGDKAAAKAGSGYPRPNTYDEMMARMETDDVTPLNDDGWDGVVGVYMRRDLTDTQFRSLHAAYLGD
jgi:hypothetical protein